MTVATNGAPKTSMNEANERDPFNNNSYGTLVDGHYRLVNLPVLDVHDFNERIIRGYEEGWGEKNLPADLSVARSLIPAGTATLRDFSNIAPGEIALKGEIDDLAVVFGQTVQRFMYHPGAFAIKQAGERKAMRIREAVRFRRVLQREYQGAALLCAFGKYQAAADHEQVPEVGDAERVSDSVTTPLKQLQVFYGWIDIVRVQR